MSMNKFMHPRNPYKDKKPNFKELAVKYDDFRKCSSTDLKGKVHLDFKNAECLRALSRALLREDFGLDVELPTDRLIPTVPLRLNYILWLEDIFGEVKKDLAGFDIGCGASCVYPLLGAAKNDWSFMTIECDTSNVSCAERNVLKNNLSDKIKVVQVDEHSGIKDFLTLPEYSDKNFDFSMCNPPFFASNLEAWGVTTSRSEDRPDPMSTSTASPAESITQGGEVGYVKRMIDDSMDLKERITVFTTMLGKKTSIAVLKNYLIEKGISNIGTTEFCQGRTMRWGLAWSFQETISFPKALRKQCIKQKQKPPLTYDINKSEKYADVTSVWINLKKMLSDLQITWELKWQHTAEVSTTITATKNTWSNQRRKRRQQHVAEVNNVEKCNGKQNETTVDRCSEEVTSKELTKTNEAEQSPTKVDQCLKRKMDEEDSDQAEKKAKYDTNCSDTVACSTTDGSSFNVKLTDDMNTKSVIQTKNDSTTDFLCHCVLKIKKTEETFRIELEWVDGLNKESMHQILQYIKNNLKNKIV